MNAATSVMKASGSAHAPLATRGRRVRRTAGTWCFALLVGGVLVSPGGLQASPVDVGSAREVVAAGSAGEVHAVKIKSFTYEPLELLIPPGASVSWTNQDLPAHTATGPDFDTGRVGSGETIVVRFESAGRFPYNCSFHANMAGVVIVGSGETKTPSDHTEA